MQQFGILIPLLIGVAAGALVVWLASRKSSEAARTQARSENLGEMARLEERASRVPSLEAQLAAAKDELAASQKELSGVSAQLDERNHFMESVRAQLVASEDEHKAVFGKLESVQKELQEKASQVASLTEQSSRLPNLESQLGTAAAETQRLNQELADLREKAGGLGSTLAAQKEERDRLESERAAFETKRNELTEAVENLKTQLAALTTELNAERRLSAEKLALLNGAKEELSNRFKALANDILEEKAAL